MEPDRWSGTACAIRPENSYVSDRVTGVMRGIESNERNRTHSDAVCRELYDRIKKDRFYYTLELALSQTAVQRIRPPHEIDTVNCGTCLDFACISILLKRRTSSRWLS